jgi:hypothetical protein
MLSGSSTPAPKLNTAAARKAGRTTIVHRISCSLERDILFRGSMRKPRGTPVMPYPIHTMVTPISAINMSQSTVMDVGGGPATTDNTTLENKATTMAS